MDFENKLRQALFETSADAIQQTFTDATQTLKGIDGQIKISDEDYAVLTDIYNSQIAIIKTVFAQYPKLLPSITSLNTLAFQAWVSESASAKSTRAWAAKQFKEDEMTIDNLIWGYDEWVTMAAPMIDQVSATDKRRFAQWVKGVGYVKELLKAIQNAT